MQLGISHKAIFRSLFGKLSKAKNAMWWEVLANWPELSITKQIFHLPLSSCGILMTHLMTPREGSLFWE